MDLLKLNWAYNDNINNNEIHLKCLKLLKARSSSPKEYLLAKKYLFELQANIGKWKMNFLGYILTYIFNKMYLQINVMVENIATIQSIRKRHPVIYIPCHKSHFDYLLIQFAIVTLHLGVPFIAAGENLNLTGVGSLLKGGGAFFIKRSFTDPIHKLVTSTYINVLLQGNHCIEFFIEGTRSRTGKLKRPKYGLLKMISSEMKSDAYIVPISITYDRVVETPSYVDELSGSEKQQESILSLIKSVSVINEKYGNISIRFGEPFSIKSYLATSNIQTLAYEILYRINDLAVISPSTLFATALLTHSGKGVGLLELTKRIDWIKERVLDRNGYINVHTAEEIIKDSLNILKNTLVKEKHGLLEQIYYTDRRYELSYYRNQLIHLFVNESLVCAVIHAHKRRDLLVNDLLQGVLYLSRLLKFEFIFRSNPIKDNLMDTLSRLERDGIISKFDDTLVCLKPLVGSPREKFEFYCLLVWPFIESYWLATVSLYSLYLYYKHKKHNESCSTARFMQINMDIGSTLHYQGDLFFMESINKDNIFNAWEYLRLILPFTFQKNEVALNYDIVVENGKAIELNDPIASNFPQGALSDAINRNNMFRMKPHTTMWRLIRCCEIAYLRLSSDAKL
eukprot:NODE_22_length_38364_cov_0.248661.p5 type:complete len:623 gc:universal NODE_22_length_38364_cov_0.248661:15996-17864(+)